MNVERMQTLTKELIAIDSTSGREGPIVDYLTTYLQKAGLHVQQFEVTPGRHNILATCEQDTHPNIFFNTHIDTVAGHYGPYEDKLRIYGRGACDTHGVLAAQLEALHDLQSEGRKGLGLLLVVGEEISHDGAIHAGRCSEVQEPSVLIVGEPTENRLMQSQKGRLKGDLTVHGIEGHSGYPEAFDSAVEKLGRFLNRLWQADWVARKSDEGTTVNVTILEPSGPDNQIPGRARVRLLFRCAEPTHHVEKKVLALLQEVSHRLPALAGEKPHFEVEWDPARNDPVTHLATLPGFDSGTAAYNTDIAYFGWKSCTTFLLGPGSILQAHTDLHGDDWLSAEWILKEEQIRGVELYKRLVREVRVRDNS